MVLAMHDDLTNIGRNRVHLDALVNMVEMRGGIEQFADNISLVQKICRYVYH